MKAITIGTATIYYDISGKVASTDFTPDFKLEGEPSLLAQLDNITTDGSQEQTVEQAHLVMANWFADTEHKLDQIDTADRTLYEIAEEVLDCVKDSETGKVKKCVIRFVFKER